MFSNCSRIDAPGSHFSNVGHDQHNVGHDQYIDRRIYFNVAETAFHETVQRALPSFPRQLLASSSIAVFASYHNRTPSDLASNLIGEIIRSLVDLTQFSVDYSYLQDPLLKPLHRTLFLTGYALQLYEDTPLGPNLAALISPEVEKCCLLFQNILDDIDRYRSTLHSSHIPASRLPALWSKSKVHALAWKLCHRQRQLGQFLVALNSITWDNFGHHLRAGPVSLREFRAFFSEGPASLRDIQVTNVKILDRLGQNILVPIIFCSSWEQFDYVIKGYCRERPGYLLVNQGDYQMIRAKDNKAVDPSEFPNAVGPGVKLEMSIVMQQAVANQTRCPRCHYVNSRLAEHMGWIECRECSGLFRIEAADQEDQSEDSNQERDSKVDEWGSGKVHSSGESRDPGIVSPAVQTGGSNTPTTEKRHRLDDGGACDARLNDDVKLFRRIHLICIDIDIPRVNSLVLDAPQHYLNLANAEAQPWYLRPAYDEKEILIDPDGSVRGGTNAALVERLTAHEREDPTFIKRFKTYLMTYKSFTTLDELFDLLVKRFLIQPPDNLSLRELEEWRKLKQHVIQMRVINTFKSMVVDDDVLEKEDMYILNRMKVFISGEDVIRFAAAKQLLILIERAQRSGDTKIKMTVHTSLQPPPAPIAPKSSGYIKLLDINSSELARQLTIIESQLYQRIQSMECLQRLGEQQTDHNDNITAVTQTSNRIANWVVDAVLSREDSRRRAAVVKQFISVADHCRGIHNYSSMVAIISGLNSPPIRRLKRTWEQINARFMTQLGACEMTIDSNKDFTNYRTTLARVSPPCVPFIGVFLTTLTFIQDGSEDTLPGNLINFRKHQKASEVIQDIKRWQSQPHNLQALPIVLMFIEESLHMFNDQVDIGDHFWNLSFEREPREREDEKLVRLLQESGFL